MIDWALGVVSLLLTALVFTRFEPLLPDPALDGSWRYAVAAAAARSLPFGRDFVFTFGPLGMLYSGFRVPSQDALYLALHLLLSAGLFAGFLLSARPAMRPALLLLPLAVVASWIPDAIFFVLPFTLVVGCARRNLPPAAWGTAVVLLAVSDGLLPLIKGTMALPVAGCTAAAAMMLARERSPWGIVLPAVTVAAALAAWAVAGQNLLDVPAYLARQSDVAAGYTDAMSVFGPPGPVLAFLALATATLALSTAAAPASWRIATALACALVLFVAFKAGFVRDDGHSLISASALALLGLLLFLGDPSRRRALLGLAVGVGGWAWIAHGNLDVSPAAVGSRFAEAFASSARSVLGRVSHPDLTFAAYARKQAEIADGFGTLGNGGTFDIYPLDQTLLLASGLPWAPRPVVQSYSAYTPALAALNAAHVAGPDAPGNLLFDVQALDDRYPSLDDGPSWPAILSRYDYRAFADGFARLQRSELSHPATIGVPFLRRTIVLGEEVVLPPDAPDDTWATLDVHPSLPNRFATILFKQPLLFIDVSYRDGQTRSYRMVAGQGAAGFLLSPTVATARDFVALKIGFREYLADKAVRSFRLRQDAPRPLRGTRIDVTLAGLAIAPDPADSPDLRGGIAPGPPLASLPAGGDCAADAVADRSPGDAPVRAVPPILPVDGWAMLSTADKKENDGLRVALTDAAGTTAYAPATKARRPGLNEAFGLSPQARIAFSSIADVRALHGTFSLHVVQDGPGGPVACDTGVTVELP